jgi:hypothetical protein
MAVNLVVISALITVGPVDAAIRTSTAALAAALPLNVAGIILLRLVQDAGFPEVDAYFPSPAERASQRARRSRVTLLYSQAIAAFSLALTLTGMAAAVWHMGHFIALILLFAVLLSAVLVTVAIAHALPRESDAERALKLRYRKRRMEARQS